jgi:hypothetical protein
MLIECESCGAVVPAAAVDLRRGLATCAACNQVFSCQPQLDRLAQAAVARPDLPMPKGIQVFRRSNGLMITRRWFSAKFIFLLVFSCFWDGFMVMWFGIALSKGQWGMAAAGTLHALVGLGVTYATVAGFINTTVITALNGSLGIRHGPLPCPGNRHLEAGQIAQLYTKRLVRHSKNGTSISYELRAQIKNGKDIKLVGLDTPEQSLFVERRLEEFLRIGDQPVPGEVERG